MTTDEFLEELESELKQLDKEGKLSIERILDRVDYLFFGEHRKGPYTERKRLAKLNKC